MLKKSISLIIVLIIFSFNITLLEGKEELSKYLELKIFLDKSEFYLNEDVQLKIRIRNISTKNIYFNSKIHYPNTDFESYIYTFDIKKPKKRNVFYNPIPLKLKSFIFLKPDEIYEYNFKLNEWFIFEEKGNYKIQFEYHNYNDGKEVNLNNRWMFWNKKAKVFLGTVTSNELEFQIK